MPWREQRHRIEASGAAQGCLLEPKTRRSVGRFERPGAGLKPARLMLIPISTMLAIGGSNTIKRPAPAQEVLRMGGS